MQKRRIIQKEMLSRISQSLTWREIIINHSNNIILQKMIPNLRWNLDIKNRDHKIIIIQDNIISQHSSLISKVQITLSSSLDMKVKETMTQVTAILIIKTEERMVIILQEIMEVMFLQIKVIINNKEDSKIKGSRHNQVISKEWAVVVVIVTWAGKIVEIIQITFMYLWIIIKEIITIVMTRIRKMKVMLAIWMETTLIANKMEIMLKITINNKENIRIVIIMEAIVIQKEEDISNFSM